MEIGGEEEDAMEIERPDLSQISPDVRAYIESLEAEVGLLKESKGKTERLQPQVSILPDEPPTTLNLITLSESGIGKRTPRHLYSRQRRGGMGVFDLDTGDRELPRVLTIADENQSLLLFTSLARVFRMPVQTLPESPIHSRGSTITGRFNLQEGETLVSALPDTAKGNVAMVSERGMVRSLRHHVFGEYMKQGTGLFDVKQFGKLRAVCWTPGDGDLLIATRLGRAIRFSEKLIPPQGGPGIKLEEGDIVVSVTPVYQESSVFLLASDGRGTIRSMQGFNPNKSAGGSGKIAMSTNSLVGIATVEQDEDIFIITRLSKVIRFMAEEVPVKEGVVQGVNCMSLRADETVAVTPSKPAGKRS
jgi:DNA gyrase subunit A